MSETFDREQLSDKTAVVTGGGRGIGAAVVRALAGSGASVVAAARTGSEIRDLASVLDARGLQVYAVPCDVTDSGQVEALAERARELLGRVDILVNNAGIAPSAPLHRTTLESWQQTFAVNCTGTFLGTRAFLPGMVQEGWGRVVNVASVAGLAGAPYIAAYAASKHAVVGFTRCVALEVAAKGVTVNAVCPGYVDTPMTDSSIERIGAHTGLEPEEARAHLRRTSPQRRLLDPAEVAAAVLNLCLDSARGINGQTVVVDGGGLAGLGSS